MLSINRCGSYNKTMPDKKYKCVQCQCTSLVSEDYFKHAYVREQCCSVSCYHKKNGITLENTQGGEFELEI